VASAWRAADMNLTEADQNPALIEVAIDSL
jgi:hypothetical protein